MEYYYNRLKKQNLTFFCKFNSLQKIYRRTMSYSTAKNNRHYPPAINEWNDSIYAYNKNYIKNTMVKNDISNNLIKSYFNLVSKPNKSKISNRMRNLRRRSTTKNLFVSKPEIKQTNNKAIFTIYVYNRQKQIFYRKLLLVQLSSHKYLKENFIKINKKIKKKIIEKFFYPINIDYMYKYKKVNLVSDKTRYRVKRKRLRKQSSKFRFNYTNYINNILSSILLKKSYINTLFISLFLKWALSIFKIKSLHLNLDILEKAIDENKNKKELLNERFENKWTKKNLNKLEKLEHYINFLTNKNNLKGAFNKTMINSEKINNIITTNTLLLKYLMYYLKKSFLERNKKKKIKFKTDNTDNNTLYPNNLNLDNLFKQKNKINLLYKSFKNKYIKIFVKNLLENEIKQINILLRLYNNVYKFNIFIPKLKSLVNKIYNNKNIELNVISLRYLHLNADNFLQAISIKLKKKKARLLRVLKRSMKLVKTPRSTKLYVKLKTDFNKEKAKFKSLSSYNNHYKIKNDGLTMLLNQFFYSKKNNKNKLESYLIKKNKFLDYPWYISFNNVLSFIKYKWITGARLEAKGRLTKRYTASRTLFKHKTKGSLKVLDLLDYDNLFKSPSIFQFRNQINPNLQYKKSSHVRRIGGFGLKTWISGN